MYAAKKLVFFGLVASLLFTAKAHAADLPQAALDRIPVCVAGNPQTPRCHSWLKSNKQGHPQATTSPTGLTPNQFLTAYNLTGLASGTKTIGIVDAYNDPNVEADLGVFSGQFGLPACTVASGCLTVVNQNGGSSLPATDSGWALEISLDVQTAHALCQNCNILLVEANSNSYSDLMAAVDRAAAMGANVISNSYGSNEFSSESLFDYHFNVPGVAITFSSGDSGYGAEYPAASRFVTAVGGTTLSMSGTTYLGESVWSGTGSGCSSFEPKPAWQKDNGCARRTVGDVSADADPNTGASVYDSVPYSGQTGWWQVGGTSLASPIIAATYAQAAVAANPYNLVSYGINMHDITSGSNGHCRRSSYLCTAVKGYDGPTGLGTPIGTGAF